MENKQFAPLLQKARKTVASWKTNERAWKTSEQSKTDKRNAPQALLVVANEPTSKKKREKGQAIDEYLPISCTLEELSVILDRWIVNKVVKLYKIDREPIEEDKKHSCFVATTDMFITQLWNVATYEGCFMRSWQTKLSK